MIEQLLNNVNLVDLVLIPILGYFVKIVTAYINTAIEDRRQDLAKTAYGELERYCFDVVQACFTQIIEPSWQALKDNPNDLNAKKRYENAKATAKERATELLKVHVEQLPDFLGNLFIYKINELIESVIPQVKADNLRSDLLKKN